LSFDKHLIIKLGGVRNSAAASQPCSSGHITTDKRIRRAITKFFSCSTEVGGGVADDNRNGKSEYLYTFAVIWV
jgi:hypothetical protein